jgi:hypothetical protein
MYFATLFVRFFAKNFLKKQRCRMKPFKALKIFIFYTFFPSILKSTYGEPISCNFLKQNS